MLVNKYSGNGIQTKSTSYPQRCNSRTVDDISIVELFRTTSPTVLLLIRGCHFANGARSSPWTTIHFFKPGANEAPNVLTSSRSSYDECRIAKLFGSPSMKPIYFKLSIHSGILFCIDATTTTVPVEFVVDVIVIFGCHSEGVCSLSHGCKIVFSRYAIWFEYEYNYYIHTI